jgi:diketogulonate reductase-like aldo/keto reductase
VILRPFGKAGRRIPTIGQGTWNFPVRGAETDEATRSLRTGIELGLVHIDTAEMYGNGRAEEIIGQAIRGVERASLFIVTKVLPQNADTKGVARSCERSLTRLGTDYVDCYLLHWRGDIPIDETMGALENLVRAGKTRFIGVSNFDPWDLKEASAALRSERVACNQILYNLSERTIEDHELPWARENGSAVVAYTPLDSPPIDPSKQKYAVLAQIARQHSVSAQAIALAFLVRDPLVFAIPKASRLEHVEANALAGHVDLTDSEIDAIDAAFPKRVRRGPLPTN